MASLLRKIGPLNKKKADNAVKPPKIDGRQPALSLR